MVCFAWSLITSRCSLFTLCSPCPLCPAMKNLTFQITPDVNKDSESIQIGRDLKLSCHVDAQPQDKVNYTWYKNGMPIYPTNSLLVLRSDPDMPPFTSSLEIADMNFRDQATYSCVAGFPGSSVPELRVDINITQNSGEWMGPGEMLPAILLSSLL